MPWERLRVRVFVRATLSQGWSNIAMSSNPIQSNLIQEFRFSLPLDNGLLIADVKSGLPIAEREILDMAANARALFTLSTVACRELGRIQACFELWTETAELFDELSSRWSGVMTDDLPRIRWLVTELERCRELSADRVETHSEGWDRRRYVKRKAADSLA
jgi:hypothetical protein